jgi:Branched-chain amino acid ATP-binding cassette transporter
LNGPFGPELEGIAGASSPGRASRTSWDRPGRDLLEEHSGAWGHPQRRRTWPIGDLLRGPFRPLDDGSEKDVVEIRKQSGQKQLHELILAFRKGGISVLLVDHAVQEVLSLADRVYVLDYGRMIAEGSPADIRRSEAVKEAYFGKVDRSAKV